MRIRTLLLEVGLIMAAIVLGAILNTPVGYCVAAVLAVAFLIAWWLSKDEGEDEFEGHSLFDGAIPSALPLDTPPITDRDPCIIPRYEKSPSATAGINNSDWFVLNNEGLVEAYDATIAEFQVGDTILRFGKAALILSKKYAIASPELFDIHRGKVPNYGIAIAFNGGWSAWCRETKPKPPLGAKFEQGSRVTYRDRANNWFSTEFTMIYDVRKDFIEIDNIKHSRLPSHPPM
jgi:hypothetical protein